MRHGVYEPSRVGLARLWQQHVIQSPSLSAQLTLLLHCSGYQRSAKDTTATAQKTTHGIRTEIPEPGNPLVLVAAFGAKENLRFNVLKLGDTMSEKGWHLAV